MTVHFKKVAEPNQ